eukprot:scaffold9756_cov139-Skeletonema_menzelii.AAC.3
MSSPSAISRRNLGAGTIDNDHGDRSDTKRKRCGKICIAITTLCALWLQVQTLPMQEMSAQDVQNVSNRTILTKINNHAMMIDDDIPIPQRRIKFIPYPHKTLGSGASMQCQWETRHNYINATTTSLLDFTQRNAYTEGICIPPTLNDTLHIFSSKEAVECLSSKVQNRNIRVILSGDSYMKQLYIGLADILMSKHVRKNEEIMGGAQRSAFVSNAQHWMEKRRENNEKFPFVQYRCEGECYGRTEMDVCSRCITQFSGNTTRGDDVWVVGVGVHTYYRLNKQVDTAVQHILHFLDTEAQHNRTIYVSPPNYSHREDYPDQSSSMDHVYRGLLPHVAPENPAHPFLDVYQLTKSCQMENCSFDGGHRSRYVNRWKAQLLLNTLCEVQ